MLMKRSLFIAALSTLAAGSVLAQSNVTIYGRLNESVERQKTGSVSSTRVQDNSSRIGFKGAEDLGGGLKALFVLEHGFNADTGTAAGAFWGRESTVGLSHASFGTLRLGNMPASEAYFATADYISMHNHDTGTSSDALWGNVNGNYVAVGGLQNTIAYTTPTFAGLRGDIQYRVPEGTANHQRAFAINYDQGALHLGFGAEANTDERSYTLRGLYELGAFTLGGYYERTSGATNFKRNNVRLAGMYTMGASEIHLNAGFAGKIDGVADSDAKQYTVGYNYNLSKRTKVYAFYTKVDNSTGSSYMTGTANTDFQSLALGIRHNF
jgi:predicted porin